MPSHFPRLIAGFSDVYLWVDGDSAGRALVREFTRKVPWAQAVYMREGEDVNSTFAAGGPEAIHAALRRVKDTH